MTNNVSNAIIYVEPNYVKGVNISTTSGLNQNVNTYTHDLEDYCVAVDLVVEVPSRGREGSTNASDGSTFVVSYLNGKTKLSFFKGTNIGGKRYLTTVPYEYTTYRDINIASTQNEDGSFTEESYANVESFGINSINISFDTFQTPIVDVVFTDIKGSSLFGAEELAHNKSTNNVRSVRNMDRAGSFFSCFFRLPYPRFSIRIKGFYGYPVSYQLNCSDFKASFDCKTGNFTANVKFVGYAFSFLTDVSFPYLLVAPYDEYIGAKYWQEKIESGDFTFNDGTKMVTLVEFVERIIGIQKDIDSISKDADSGIAKVAEDISKINAVTSYATEVEEKFTDTNELSSFGGEVVYSESLGNYIIAIGESDGKIKNENKFKDFMKEVIGLIESGNTANETAQISGLNMRCSGEELLTYNDLLQNCPFISKASNQLSSYKTNYKFAYLDVASLKNNGQRKESALQDEQEVLANKKAEEINNAIEEELGFKPNIENIVRILFAQLDVFSHCVSTTAENANNTRRTMADLHLSATDVMMKNGEKVPPFPRVVRNRIDGGKNVQADSWLGSKEFNVSAAKAPEISLINGLMNATASIADKLVKLNEMNQTESADISGDGGTEINDEMMYASSPIDIAMKFASWIRECDTNDIGDVVGKVILRAFSVLGLNKESIGSSDAEKIGKRDSRNFAKNVTNPSSTFLDSLSNDVFTPEGFINAALNSSTEFQTNGSWPWNKDGGDKNLLKKVSDKYTLSNSMHIGYNKQTKNSSNLIWYTKIPCQNIVFKKSYGTKYILSYNGKNDNDAILEPLLLDVNYKKYNDLYNACDDKGLFEYMDFSNGNRLGNKDVVETFQLMANTSNDKDDKYTYTFGEKSDMLSYHGKTAFKKSRELRYPITTISTLAKDGSIETKRIDKTVGKRDYYASNSNNFFLPQVYGVREFYEVDKTYLKKESLFGQKCYYSQSDEFKSLLFLYSMNGCGESIGFKALAEEFVSQYKSIEKLGGYMHYTCILFFGCYLYLVKNGIEPINNKVVISVWERIKGMLVSLNNLTDDYKKVLIDKYEEWFNEDFINIQNNLELKKKDGTLITESDITMLSNAASNGKKWGDFLKDINSKLRKTYNTIEEFILDYFSDEFFDNYALLVGGDNTNLILVHKPNSSIAKKLAELIYQPCFFLKLREDCTKTSISLKALKGLPEGRSASVSKSILTNYLSGFISGLKDYYKDKIENNNTTEGEISTNSVVLNTNTKEEIQSACYSYCKKLYDGWLSNTTRKINEKFSVTSRDNNKSFLNRNIHYIDSFYNYCGDITVNAMVFKDMVISCLEKSGYNLLSFISDFASSNNFALTTVQNFLDLTGKGDSEEKIRNIFEPIPFNKCIWGDDLDEYPDLVFIYNFEFSSKLNMKDEDGDFVGDSFNLTDPIEMLPTAITTKTSGDYMIPAIGVTYGMQNQSYFQDIQISMDSPVNTEAAIKAQYNIAQAQLQDSQGGDNGTESKVSFIAQDLFTVYSNYSYECTVKMMGCAYIQPLMYFQLNNIPLFNGAYIIYKVSHSIEPGNMTTTFTGNRICNVQSTKVKEPLFIRSKISHASGNNGYSSVPQGLKASLFNNCAYKHFSSNGEGKGPKVNVDVYCVDLTNKKTLNGQNLNPKLKFVDLLAIVGTCEGGLTANDDMLGFKLNLTTVYNIYQTYNGDIQQIGAKCAALHSGATSFENWCDIAKKPSYKGYAEKARAAVREVFEESPTCLIGKQTNVSTSVDMYDAGKIIGKSKSETITLDMVQRMTSYSTIKYHIVNDKVYYVAGGEYHPSYSERRRAAGLTTDDGSWRIMKHTWCCQHEWSPNTNNSGHIYSGTKTKCWEVTSTNDTTKNSKTTSDKIPSEKAEGVFNSIKMTCDYSEEINIGDITMEQNVSDVDGFYITCTSSSGLAQVFDVIINTYYDDVSKIIWCTDNDTNSLPSKILVSCAESTKKLIGVGVKNGNTYDIRQFSNTDYSGGHEYFYMSLSKKYGEQTSASITAFQNECKNFSAKPSNGKAETLVNKILNYSFQACQDGANSCANGGM